MERTDHVLGDYIKAQTCSGEVNLRRRLLAVAVGLGCYSECLCVCGCVPTPQRHPHHTYGAGSRGLCQCRSHPAWPHAGMLILEFGAAPGHTSAVSHPDTAGCGMKMRQREAGVLH